MGKTAITDVLVFDGTDLKGPTNVIIDGDIIGQGEDGAETIDGTGCTLLPGLIDCHVHVSNPGDLDKYARYGITTVLDMSSLGDSKPFRTRQHTADYRTSGTASCAPNSRHAQLFKWVPGFKKTKAVVHNEDEAVQMVELRVSEGVDYIKFVADEPGFDQAVMNKITATAREHDKMTVAHAAHYAAYQRALEASVDVVTHIPMDKAVGQDIADRMVREGRIVVPTLTMMENFIKKGVKSASGRNADFGNALAGVKAMHDAGVPILAGTDTNTHPMMSQPIGDSLHHELELLVQAGLSPTEALRAATSLAAKYFHLANRGSIAPGLRADLLLVEGDPTRDIKATRSIKKVWCSGTEISLEEAGSLWSSLWSSCSVS